MALYEITLAGHSFWMEQESDFVVQALQKGEMWETTALNLWAEICRDVEGTIVDVGAYTGIYSLLAAKANKQVPIEAFEPLKPVFNRLHENVILNHSQDRIVLHNIALSSTTAPAVFHITGKSQLPSGSSIDPHPTMHDVAIIPILVQTGDSFFQKKDISLIKIDVERHEQAVLQGFRNTIVRCRPVCFIEILDKRCLETIVSFMRLLGYHAELICEDLKSTVTDNRLWNPKVYRTNYLFRPS